MNFEILSVLKVRLAGWFTLLVLQSLVEYVDCWTGKSWTCYCETDWKA
jgi:hypothetical protein